MILHYFIKNLFKFDQNQLIFQQFYTISSRNFFKFDQNQDNFTDLSSTKITQISLT